MSKILGSSGVITLGGLAGIISASITRASEAIETTVMGATSKAFIAGIKSFALEAEAIGSSPALAESFTGIGSLEGVKSFEIEGSAEAIDVTAIGDIDPADDLPYRSFIGGLPEWSGSVELHPETDTVLPVEGGAYTFAGASCIITEVGPAIEVNGIMTVSVSLKGAGALPTIITSAPGGSVAFEMETSGGGLAAGDAVVTSFKASGAVGELIKYSISAQGTGIVGLPAEA
jgi:predicted secreted protein